MEQVNNIERTLGKILATQEQILKQLEKHDSKLEDHIKEDKQLEQRVDRVESRLMYAAGIAVTLITMFSITSDVLLAKLGMK